jgi:hypothetical protein
MQLFGFRDVPVADEAVAENLTTLDIVVVFDISGSMEDQTNCHDCWVRTTYDITSSPYPSNGYFNPIPYDPKLAPGAPNQSVPLSRLCTDPPTPWLQKNGATTYKYLTMEAELYSANVGNWNLTARAAGQGFWAIQRGSRGSVLPAGIDTAENNNYQGNQAGLPNNQSSSVCGPALPNGINCKINNGTDDICSSADGGIARDCSAYIAARPYQAYGQAPGAIPNPNGASYNLDCFLPGAGPFTPTVLSGACWNNVRTSDNAFLTKTGPGPGQVPWVEYDFTPTWTGSTYIWIRAMGGSQHSYMWRGPSPDDLDSSPGDNLPAWRKVVFWQINNGEVFIENDNSVAAVKQYADTNQDNWRANRAVPDYWRWVKLGSTATTSGTQTTLKLYQGSAGYMIDKIVFTNDPGGSTGSPPPAMLLKRNSIDTDLASGDGREAFGPPASYGSATREACNVCNPIYGNTVNQAMCSCLKNNAEASKRYLPTYPGYDPNFKGSGQGCSSVPSGTTLSMLSNVYSITVSPPNVQPPQVQTRTIVNDLYSNQQPIRSAQEAVKNFVLGNGVEEKYRLKPGFDQVGFVAFTTNIVNGTGGSSRAKLQCLRTMTPVPTDAATCYGKVLNAVEHQWPNGGTNISEGMREGLEELGLSIGSNTNVDSTCTSGVDDKHACDRKGAAKRVLILMTDGSPNNKVTNCSSQPGYADYWDGLIGPTDPDFDCAMWYAQQAAAKGVTVYTIGIGGGANTDFLTTMATGVDPRSGGTPVPMFSGAAGKYFSAVTPADLDGIFREILTSISVRIVG